MALRSNLFEGDERLNACLVSDPAHVVPGAVGDHVRKIQVALAVIDGLVISSDEALAGRYGTTTAAAVLAYKKKRKIINRSYQNKEDNIVGKFTIKALDDDLFSLQRDARPASPFCQRISTVTREGKKPLALAELQQLLSKVRS